MNTLKLLFSARKHSFANQKQIRRIAVKEAKLFQLWNALTELNASEQQDQREKREKRWLWHTVGSKNLLSRCSSVVEHSTERKNNDHNLCLLCIFLSLNPFYKSPTFHKIYLFISISWIFDNSREDSTLVFWATLNWWPLTLPGSSVLPNCLTIFHNQLCPHFSLQSCYLTTHRKFLPTLKPGTSALLLQILSLIFSYSFLLPAGFCVIYITFSI